MLRSMVLAGCLAVVLPLSARPVELPQPTERWGNEALPGLPNERSRQKAIELRDLLAAEVKKGKRG